MDTRPYLMMKGSGERACSVQEKRDGGQGGLSGAAGAGGHMGALRCPCRARGRKPKPHIKPRSDVPVRRVRRAVLGFEMCSRPDSRPLGPGTLAHRPVDRNL